LLLRSDRVASHKQYRYPPSLPEGPKTHNCTKPAKMNMSFHSVAKNNCPKVSEQEESSHHFASGAQIRFLNARNRPHRQLPLGIPIL
jgi:hypothetical protein